MQRKIERWLEKLPVETVSIVLRAGDSRQTENILERWAPDEFTNIIDECVESMMDENVGRLIAYGEKGKQLRSVTLRNSDVSHNESDTSVLVDGLLRMADEQRRFLATMSDSFAVMHETIQDTIYQEREKNDEINELQIALALAEIQANEQGESTTSRALNIFSQILQQKASEPVDQVQRARDMVLNNPDIIDGLLEDDSIVDIVTKKIINVGSSSE